MGKNGVLRLNSMAEFEALKERFGPKNMAKLNNIVAHSIATNSKFHAVQTESSGIKFATKKEARYFQELQARKHMGDIKYILRQVPFDLPGHYENGKIVRHFVDFAICLKDNTFQFIEVKGRDLPMGKLKRLQVEEIYNIKIVVV